MNIFEMIISKVKELAFNANEQGIPVPLLRDPVSKKGSYTLTMFFIVFNIAILTLVGKITKLLGDVDYNNVLWLLGITGSFYLGRGMRKDGTKMELTAGDKE